VDKKYNDMCMTRETPSNTGAFGLVLSSVMAVVAATETNWNLDYLYKYVQSVGPTCGQ